MLKILGLFGDRLDQTLPNHVRMSVEAAPVFSFAAEWKSSDRTIQQTWQSNLKTCPGP
ncbi:hypothetical protein OGM63_10335 [Plectonema radiosum NIES-515]|uniref:Transposase n=1 Tax=Plectonema radiosum NIES-515 TaxID=2986073 RepID=A0ABT3AXS5_9CYAN|nr:hypothetical protein [Plectonema radiosum]MCV3213906.1 hypothetical protein [Plectonema radiosum NIES-515]